MARSNHVAGFDIQSTGGMRGFQMTFENGYTVSVQFGVSNYCENRDYKPDAEKSEIGASPSAEIAAWDQTGKWVSFEHDDVKGWCKPDEVAAFITKIASLK